MGAPTDTPTHAPTSAPTGAPTAAPCQPMTNRMGCDTAVANENDKIDLRGTKSGHLVSDVGSCELACNKQHAKGCCYYFSKNQACFLYRDMDPIAMPNAQRVSSSRCEI